MAVKTQVQDVLFVMLFFACRSHISNGFDADLCSLAWYEVDVTCTNVANTAGFPGALVLLNKKFREVLLYTIEGLMVKYV